jgi:hypothetical protein
MELTVIGQGPDYGVVEVVEVDVGGDGIVEDVDVSVVEVGVPEVDVVEAEPDEEDIVEEGSVDVEVVEVDVVVVVVVDVDVVVVEEEDVVKGPAA